MFSLKVILYCIFISYIYYNNLQTFFLRGKFIRIHKDEKEGEKSEGCPISMVLSSVPFVTGIRVFFTICGCFVDSFYNRFDLGGFLLSAEERVLL